MPLVTLGPPGRFYAGVTHDVTSDSVPFLGFPLLARPGSVYYTDCSLDTTRLSELCYDTHTLCETCRDKVCDLNSFCEECESWTPEFRKLYLRHKRTLYLKRVSKRDAKSKAKSPP